MGKIDQGWYDLGENTQYPFDQAATLEDDSGQTLPCAILADFSITIPKEFGDRVYCSGISKQAGSASLIFAGDAAGYPTVAAATIPLSAKPRRSLRLEPLAASVQGVVVPGALLWELPSGTWRFSHPNQAYLSQRTVYTVATTSDQDFRLIYGSTPLERVLSLAGDVHVKAEIAQRLLGGQLRRALVLSLLDSGQESSLKAYAGKYQQRPEARTCGDPAPVETINLVEPDCCGRIFIELRGCARPIAISNHCGVVLDCPMEAGDMCQPQHLTPEDPGADYCQAAGGADPVDPPPDAPVIPPWWSMRS